MRGCGTGAIEKAESSSTLSGDIQPVVQQMQATADGLRQDADKQAIVQKLDQATDSLTKALNVAADITGRNKSSSVSLLRSVEPPSPQLSPTPLAQPSFRSVYCRFGLQTSSLSCWPCQQKQLRNMQETVYPHAALYWLARRTSTSNGSIVRHTGCP